MEETKKTTYYKYCIVPMCSNTTKKTPNKLFIRVPEVKNRRIKWFKACRRNIKLISEKNTALHVCEDHFNLQEDMENYVKFKLMGGLKKIKPNVVPHIFDCEPDRKRSSRAVAVKREGMFDFSEKVCCAGPDGSKEVSPEQLEVLVKTENCEIENQPEIVIDEVEIKHEEDDLEDNTNEIRSKEASPEQLEVLVKTENCETFNEIEKQPEIVINEKEIKHEEVDFEEEGTNEISMSSGSIKIEELDVSKDSKIYKTKRETSLTRDNLQHTNLEAVDKFKCNETTSQLTAEFSNFASVQYLKTINFSSLSMEEKMKIKNSGRSKPNLLITNVTKCKTRDYKRTFKIETYEKTDWLCGCDVNNSLYCFPCLLFAGDDQTEWTKSGVTNLSHLSEKIKKHQNSKAHLSAKLEFNLLGKQDIRQQLNSTYRLSIEKHNEQVKNNRYVLSKIINSIKLCDAFELALRGHDEGKDCIFKGLINFSAELDLALGEHLQQATVLKGTSKEIQNDLLECMLSVCQAHIKKEIGASKFVSVMSYETSDISNIFQMVLVFRYTLPNGTPVERFWTFINPIDQDAVALADCIENVLNSVLKNSDQLISQSYDGASVMSGGHGGVQKIIQDKFPYAYYVHCYEHQLNLIMSQATSKNINVRIFFSDLRDIANFFSNSPQRVTILDEIVGKRVPRGSTTSWDFKIGTVTTVYENREALMECMEKIQFTSRQSDTIIKAGALLRLLNDPKFVVWLTVFHRLMPHVDILYSHLEKGTDSVTIKQYITEFEENIQKERHIIHTMRDSILVDYDVKQSRKRRKVGEKNSYVSTTVQAVEVCDTIITQIKRRFSFTGYLEIAKLFSVEHFEMYSPSFPHRHLDLAIRIFPFLDRNKLKTELEIIYSRTDFREVSGAVHLLKFLIDNNLQADFSETFVVLQTIVTIPMTTSEAERCFLTLKRIKTFLRSTMDQDKLTALAMLSIEKQMIQDIPNFNQLVIEEFISKKDSRLHFQYKTCL